MEEKVIEFLSKSSPENYNFEENFGDLQEDDKWIAEQYVEKPCIERYLIFKAVYIKKEESSYQSAMAFIEECDRYRFLREPDGSNSKNMMVHNIYNALWLLEDGIPLSEKEIYKIPYDKQRLYGGDTINSAQDVLNALVYRQLNDFQQIKDKKGNYIEKSRYVSLRYMIELFVRAQATETGENLFIVKLNESASNRVEEFLGLYHTIGNFILVPKGFNQWRGLNGRMVKVGEKLEAVKDNFGRSLLVLKGSETNAEKKVKEEKWKLDPEDYRKYINYFFLWDYVDDMGEPIVVDEKNCEEFIELACKRIKRRGCFIVLMLRIYIIVGKERYIKMRDKIFLIDFIYKNYQEVIEEIKRYLEKAGVSKAVLTLIDDTNEKIESV